MKALLALLLALVSGVAFAQSYPSKPVRLIIPFPPGGSNDVVGRAIGQQLSERLGQGVVISALARAW
jgi:tripartite-type tricarboxylate transporter receptor subunit TctC